MNTPKGPNLKKINKKQQHTIQHVMIALTNAISDTIVNQKDKQDHPPTRTKGQTR